MWADGDSAAAIARALHVSPQAVFYHLLPPRTFRKQKVLKIHPNLHGYMIARLFAQGKVLQVPIHRLVVSAFLGSIPAGMHVNHKNGIKDDNKLENLEIVTPSANALHAYKVLGRFKQTPPHVPGEQHGNAKFTNAEALVIRQRHADGMTCYALSQEYNVAYSTIKRIVSRASWTHLPQQSEDTPHIKHPQRGSTKLTNAEVLDIRAKRHQGSSIAQLMELYPTSEQNLYRIILGQSWKHLPLCPEAPEQLDLL